jgi:hypothetical protein
MIEKYNHVFGDAFRKRSIVYPTFFAGGRAFYRVEFTCELCLFFIGELVVHNTLERKTSKVFVYALKNPNNKLTNNYPTIV